MVGFEMMISIYPGKRGEFLQAFDLLTKVDSAGDKRIDLEIFEKIKNANSFLWIEHWDNKEALSDYCQGQKFRAMMGAIDAMGQVITKRFFSVTEVV